jgi:hypothetical protein
MITTSKIKYQVFHITQKGIGRIFDSISNYIKELLITFIGLLAALLIDGHIQARKDRKEYIDSLRGIYGELAENLIRIDEKMKILNEIENYIERQTTDVDFSSEITDSIFLSSEPTPLKNNIWLETNRSVFEDRNILSNLRLTHNLYYSVESSFKNINIKVTELGGLGWNIKYVLQSGADSNELRARWSYLVTTNRVVVAGVQGECYDAKNSTKMSMRQIRYALEKFGVTMDEIFSIHEKANFARAHLQMNNISEAIRWGIDGLNDFYAYSKNEIDKGSIIDSQAMLNYTLGCAYLSKAINKEGTYDEMTENLLQAKKYIKQSIDKDPEAASSYLCLAAIEAHLNNKNSCLEFIEICFKKNGFNREMAKFLLPNTILSSDELNEIIRKYNHKPIYPRD